MHPGRGGIPRSTTIRPSPLQVNVQSCHWVYPLKCRLSAVHVGHDQTTHSAHTCRSASLKLRQPSPPEADVGRCCSNFPPHVTAMRDEADRHKKPATFGTAQSDIVKARCRFFVVAPHSLWVAQKREDVATAAQEAHRPTGQHDALEGRTDLVWWASGLWQDCGQELTV